MSDFRKMLERWVELKPNSYPDKYVRVGPEPIVDIQLRVQGKDIVVGERGCIYPGYVGIVQEAVQEAIISKDWGFSLSNVFEPSSGDSPAITGGFDAQVYVSKDGNYADTIWCADADTPAEALLSAYLQALESV